MDGVGEEGVEEDANGGGGRGFGKDGLDVVDIGEAQVACGKEAALFEALNEGRGVD